MSRLVIVSNRVVVPEPGKSAPPGQGDRREAGICECSGAHTDSNPRSSSALASAAAVME